MLLGFPLDYRTVSHIQAAIAAFGQLLFWEEDKRHLNRIILKARVTSLEDVPQFIVFSESKGFQGQSWMIQCDIMQ
jgi:hypothetical protein